VGSLRRSGTGESWATGSSTVGRSRTLDRNVASLQDRGHVPLFEPSAAEVRRQAGTWFDDMDIYEWFGANLHRVREPSMRHYVRARVFVGPMPTETGIPVHCLTVRRMAAAISGSCSWAMPASFRNASSMK
jgi:hypothetical protein